MLIQNIAKIPDNEIEWFITHAGERSLGFYRGRIVCSYNGVCTYVTLAKSVEIYISMNERDVEFSAEPDSFVRWLRLVHKELTGVSVVKKPASRKIHALLPPLPANIQAN